MSASHKNMMGGLSRSDFLRTEILALPISRPRFQRAKWYPPAVRVSGRWVCELNPKLKTECSPHKPFTACDNGTCKTKRLHSSATRLHATSGDGDPPASSSEPTTRQYVGVPLDYYCVLGLDRDATTEIISAMHAKIISEEPDTAKYGKEMKLSRSQLLAHILHELSIPQLKEAYDEKLNESEGWPTVLIQLEWLPGALALTLEVCIGVCDGAVSLSFPA